MRRPMKMFALMTALFLTGCATLVDLTDPAGAEISGSLYVMWVGEGDPSSGDGKFMFVPDPADRLTFKRKDASARGAVIRPDVMYTDGGSIPRVAQAFRGLSPWGYAPAYMVHDWLFLARSCLRDNVDRETFASLEAVTFEDSAQILYEAIEALVASRKVKRDDATRDLIANAVGSSVARAIWDTPEACANRRVPKALADKARANLRGEPASAPMADTFARRRAPPRAGAGPIIVQKISF